MKKLTLLLFAFFLMVRGTMAGEYVAYQPSSPIAISWDNLKYTGVQFDTQNYATFTTLSENDIVKIHVTNVGTDKNGILKFKVGNGWDWADIPEASYDFDNGVFSFTIQGGTAYYGNNNANSLTFTANEMIDWIKSRGLIISGIYYKMLDITVSTPNVSSEFYSETLVESHNCGSWNSTEIIASGTTLHSCDYITATVTLNTTSNSGQAIFQIKGNGNNEFDNENNLKWTTLSNNGATWMAANSDAKNVTIEMTSEELNLINTYGLALNGDNVTVTNVVYHHKLTPAGYRPVYIPASGYATFYGASTCALPDGVTAYYVSETTSETATLTSLSNIPANEGVILAGTTGIYQIYNTDEDAATATNNKLVGVTTRTQITDTSNKYVLYDNSGTPEFRTIIVNTYLDAYKCYVSSAGAGARLQIVFDDSETNGIGNASYLKAESEVRDNKVYDLSGRKVAELPTGSVSSTLPKGMYIVNGKKIIVK